jgi:hypothetical protein
MAYLTKYTFLKLCKKLEINCEIDLNLFIDNIYEDRFLFKILNKKQIKFLFIHKLLLQDESKFIIDYYQKMPEKKDQQNYVLEKGGKPKYHISDSCEYLQKNFIGFIIPIEIKKLGNETIEEFRSWFKSKGYIEDFHLNNLDKNKVIFDYNFQFRPKYKLPFLKENHQLTDNFPNSNVNEINYEFDLGKFKEKLNELKKQLMFKFHITKESQLISKNDWARNKTDEEIKKIMSFLHREQSVDYLRERMILSNKIKEAIITELLIYSKWKYGKKLKSFERITLEDLGLAPCKFCS